MIKLTKKEKAVVMEEAITLVATGVTKFMCMAIGLVLMDKHEVKIKLSQATDIYPELLKYKPKGVLEDAAWFKREIDPDTLEWMETKHQANARGKRERLVIMNKVLDQLKK